MEKEKKINKKTNKRIFRRLTIFSYIVSLLTLITIFLLDVLPIKYFSILSIVIILINIFVTYCLLGRGWKKRLFGTIFAILEIMCFIYVIFNASNTISFLKTIGGNDYNTENYSVIVLKSSNYNHLKDLNEKTVGVITGDDEGITKAREKAQKKVDIKYKEYDDLNDLDNDFLNGNLDAILIEDAEVKILEDENETFYEKEKVIYKFSIDIKINNDLSKEVDITKNSFNIFISGIDTYGKITSVSRSDVNMLVTINPKSHKILLTSIPRDYYVKLNGISTTYKDKLTHAGIHGIDTSVKTVEDLLDTDINYYAKVNFTSLISLVDTLGGITVNNDKEFRAYYIEDEVINYYFKKGEINLNGKQALAYSRERKSLPLGDIERNKHQAQVLEAIINKAISKQIITKYNNILSSLENKVTTNMKNHTITKFIKYQLKENPSWEINTNNLIGTGSYDYTYSYKNSKAYVMLPDTDSLNEAKIQIKNLLSES